jgi:Tol biopolymer transport system component
VTSRISTVAAAVCAILLPSCQAAPVPARDVVYTSSSDVQAEQIWRMGPDGSEPRPVTPGTEGVSESFAVWSPNGASIAFMSNRHQPGQPTPAIFIMNADGSEIRKVGPDDVPFQAAPDFSPDGDQIVFSGGASPFETDLYVMGLDGSGVRQLTTSGQMDRCPRWSPDGSQILFLRGNDELLVLDLGSNQVSEVLPPDIEGQCGDWSPDGSKIVFASSPDGQLPSLGEVMAGQRSGLEIYVLELTTREVVHFPQAGPLSNYPRWSRDGQQILFHGQIPPGEAYGPDYADSPGANEIYAISADGSTVRQVTSNGVLDVHPNW